MAKTIVQKVVFKNVAPKELYNLYMDAKLHSEMTGGDAKITDKEGTSFSAYGGYCKGKNIHLVKNELIVQTWRAEDWDKNDPDSIFTIMFEQKGKDTVVHAVHAFLPDKFATDISKGWHDYYWTPWKQHLSEK